MITEAGLFPWYIVFIYFVLFIQQIRRKMIDGQTGSNAISTLVKSQDEVIVLVKVHHVKAHLFRNVQMH